MGLVPFGVHCKLHFRSQATSSFQRGKVDFSHIMPLLPYTHALCFDHVLRKKVDYLHIIIIKYTLLLLYWNQLETSILLLNHINSKLSQA